jgi:elongation factor G
VGVQGAQHLKRITGKLTEAFGIDVECSEVETTLFETIRTTVETHHRHRKQSGGAGQFADVVVTVSPGAPGSGFEFRDTVKGGVVPRNYIPAVEAGARDAMAAGPAGHPVVDVCVTLQDGKAHSVDSSDFAFRTAAKNAVGEALAEGGTTLLQPILKVTLQVPSVFVGGLVQLVTSAKGQVLGFEAHPTAKGWDVFQALLPSVALEDLSRGLGSVTRGTAWFTSELDHYEETRTG